MGLTLIVEDRCDSEGLEVSTSATSSQSMTDFLSLVQQLDDALRSLLRQRRKGFLMCVMLQLPRGNSGQVGGIQAASSASQYCTVHTPTKELVQFCTLASYDETLKKEEELLQFFIWASTMKP